MLSKPITIRPAEPADAPAIAEVQVLSWQQAYVGLIPDQYLGSLHTSLSRREAFWCESIAAGRVQVHLACADEKVVGFIAIGPCRDEDASEVETGEVTAFYLLPQYWRTGVGRLLWAAGLQCLAEQGYYRFTLWVLSENQRARCFYREVGWGPEPESERSLLIGGANLREIRYRFPAGLTALQRDAQPMIG